MRKLVLGIALVVCLDVAFILMMANETRVPDMARAVVSLPSVPLKYKRPALEPEAGDDSEEIADPDPGWSAHVKRYEPRSRSGPAAFRPRARDTEKTRDHSSTVGHLFPDQIIYIGQHDTYGASSPTNEVSTADDSAEPELEAAENSTGKSAENTAENRERSFESRAFGVIKKPFKWIRSIASKFNR